jgi:MarR family transcriptional regulator, 2-MHQ and catechol-resistance regulon repressor
MLLYPALEAKRVAVERFIKDEISALPVLQGLHPVHLYILHELYAEDRQHASTLAKRVGQMATSFTPTLDKLEAVGFIVREADPNDRRSVFICLTNGGNMASDIVEVLIRKIEKEFKGK